MCVFHSLNPSVCVSVRLSFLLDFSVDTSVSPSLKRPIKAVFICNGTLKIDPIMKSLVHNHTPSTAFRHLPPNSARFSYATEGVLFISAQLSSDAVSTLRKIRVLI